MTVYCRYFQKTYCVVTRHTAYLLIKSNETIILHRKLYISIMKKTSVCTKFKIFGNYSFLKNSFLPLNISVTKKIASLKNDVCKYRKVASTNASRFVTRLVFKHNLNLDFLIRNTS